MFRFIVHYGIHFIVPIIIAFTFYKKKFLKAAFILLSAILIDLDHLLANPIYDPNRCSINFHLLHTYPFIIIYSLLLISKKTRLFGIALLLHILADTVDCLFI
jgi:hypothetical protein